MMSPKSGHSTTDSPISVGDYRGLQISQCYTYCTQQQILTLPTKSGEVFLFHAGTVVPIMVPLSPAESSHRSHRGGGTSEPSLVPPNKEEVTMLSSNDGQTPPTGTLVLRPVPIRHCSLASDDIQTERSENPDPNLNQFPPSSEAPRFPDLSTPNMQDSNFQIPSLTSSNQQCEGGGSFRLHKLLSGSININRTSNSKDTTMAHTASGVSQTTLVTSRTGVSRQKNISRRRSRAIAIKQTPASWVIPDDSSANDDRDGYAADLEWSTWCMYNRILDHRQKHPVGAEHELTSQESDVQSTSTAAQCQQHFPVLPAHQVHFNEEPLEGEVFDFEL